MTLDPTERGRLAAYVLTCPERGRVLQNTLANLRASDWGDEPRVLENRDASPDRRLRIQRGAHALLQMALAEGADFILYLEDDLVFNRHLRHNLARWAPLAAASPDAPFFASLFRPPGVQPVTAPDSPHDWQLAPAEAYGNLALVLSRATVRYVLEHWSEEAPEADLKLARLAARLGPLRLHAPSLVQHVGGQSVWGGPFLQAMDFAPLWRAGDLASPLEAPLDPSTAAAAMDRVVAELPSAPPEVAGAGVVIAAGGLAYLSNAWVTVRLLRRHGCPLPIQLWHLGPEELPESLRRIFAGEGVTCVDAHAVFAQHPARQIRGWALKSYAVMASPFRHVLLLDADNVPVLDPSFLLETEPYQRHGAIFWPDRADGVGLPGSLLRANHPIWRLTGLAYRGDPSFESGQLCVDKARCWRPLRLALWMNEHADFWYRFLHGDKDTFHIAWRKLDAPWAMPATTPRLLDDRAFAHVDFDGRVVFQHRFGDKWRLDGANPPIAGFVHEDRCREELADLRRRLFAELSVGGRARGRLAPGRWLWQRAGRPPRVLTFAPEGFVDGGSDKSARLWSFQECELHLLGDDLSVTGRFRFVPPARWLGVGTDGASLVRME